MNIFGILAPVLGFIMDWILKLIPVYGWAIIIFTVFTKLVMLPLSIKQQKSTAYMSAYQKPLNEIRDKYKDDKNKQSEEMMKFQKENGISMTAGCLPMIANMFVIFGLIDVLYYPLQQIFGQTQEAVYKAAEAVGLGSFDAQGAFQMIDGVQVNILESMILADASREPGLFAEFFGDAINEMANLDFYFLGLDLTAMPGLDNWVTLILPTFTIISMVAIQLLTTKMTGQEMPGAMKYMPWILAVTFGFFCFNVPVAFSLYYSVSNVLMFIQSFFLRKMYDPAKIKAQVEEELAAKIKEKKKKKQIVLKDESGIEQVKDVTKAELDKIRLEKARELAAKKYED